MSVVRTTAIQIVHKYNTTLDEIRTKTNDDPTDAEFDLFSMTIFISVIIFIICLIAFPHNNNYGVTYIACFMVSLLLCGYVRVSSITANEHSNRIIDKYTDTPHNIYNNPEKAARHGARHNSRQISLGPIFRGDIRVTDFYTKGIMTMDERIIGVINELILLDIEDYYRRR
jgi:hypothetical protein